MTVLTVLAILVRYAAVDGFAETRRFKTLAGARRYAETRVGATPELGSDYAVSFDGVGTITVEGCALVDLFPAAGPRRQRRRRLRGRRA